MLDEVSHVHAMWWFYSYFFVASVSVAKRFACAKPESSEREKHMKIYVERISVYAALNRYGNGKEIMLTQW